MKILFVAPHLPSPARFGGQRRMEGLMRGLARRHDVSILSFNSLDAYAEESVAATAAYCEEVMTLPGLDPRSLAEKRHLHDVIRVLGQLSVDFFLKIDASTDLQVFEAMQ